MKTIRLHMDHTRPEGGKMIRHLSGTVISVTDTEYEQIVLAVQQTRASNRDLARKTPGTPEWKANQNDL